MARTATITSTSTPELQATSQAGPDRPDRSTLGTAPMRLRSADREELWAASLEVLPPESDYEKYRRSLALARITDYLQRFPGDTWQARWVAGGMDADSRPWPDEPEHNRRGLLFRGTTVMLCLGILQPDYPWLCSSKFVGMLANVRAARDPKGYARLEKTIGELRVGERAAEGALVAATRIGIRTALPVAQFTKEIVLEFDQAYRDARGGQRTSPSGHEALWLALHRQGQIVNGPSSLKIQRYRGPQTIEELVDRYALKCKPVRDLIVGYIAERSAGLDYNSQTTLAFWLGKLFWADLEQHHPGIDSLELEPKTAAAWKKRVSKRTTTKGEVIERANRHQVLSAVRSFYLDLNQWAHEDPARWAPWAVRCPVSKSDLAGRRKHADKLEAKMHARSRSLAMFVEPLATTAAARHAHAVAVLAAVEEQPPGTVLAVDGKRYEVIERSARNGRRRLVQPQDGREAYNPRTEEYAAFWAWAAIDAMRLSGLRIEELMELTHLSIRRYTQPDGQVIPLLQVAPSKIDTERVFPISPELAHVLAQIVQRVRAGHDSIPSTPRYDTLERVWGPPLPHLFQRPYGGGHQVFSPASIRNWIEDTAALAQLKEVDGTPVRFTPHDFRRLFATDVVNTGLPIHIAAAILGHKAIDTTRGYAAIYPQEVIRAYQTFIQARRRVRPTAEYREPTEQEWEEFEKHFVQHDVAYGKCERPYGSRCVHEHACVRCPMLRPQPSRLPLIRTLETNLIDRIAEAKKNVWLGEVTELENTLKAAREKAAYAERLVASGVTDTPVPMG